MSDEEIHRCGFCNAALDPDGPSPYFDSEACMLAWWELLGERHPNAEIRVFVDTAAFVRSVEQLGRAMEELGRALAQGLTELARTLGEAGGGFANSARRPPAAAREIAQRFTEAQRTALEARRNRNTGPPVPRPGARGGPR